MSLNKNFVLVFLILLWKPLNSLVNDQKTEQQQIINTTLPTEFVDFESIQDLTNHSQERELSLVNDINEDNKKHQDKKSKKTNKRKLDDDRSVYRERVPRRFMKAGGESPTNQPFEATFHDSDLDYFTLTLPFLGPEADRVDIMRNYLIKWMNLNPKTENISVFPMKINEITVGNRFKGEYLNKVTGFSKTYYFDVNFQDELVNMAEYKKEKFIIIDTDGDYEYGKEYVHTLNKDCTSIKQKIKGVIKMECYPLVNNNNYVVKNVYKVVMQTTKKNKKGIFVVEKIFVVDGEVQAKGSQSGIDKNPPAKVLPTIAELVDNYFKQLNNPIYIEDSKNQEVRDKMQVSEKKIIEFRERIDASVIPKEKAYVADIKDETWNSLSKNRSREIAHIKTLNLLRKAAEQINGYHIDLGIRMMNHLVDYIDKYRAYNTMVEFYKKEIKITKLIDYLDYLWYLRDKELDDNYEKYLRN